jgi:inositol-hexakisphosphate kinase
MGQQEQDHASHSGMSLLARPSEPRSATPGTHFDSRGPAEGEGPRAKYRSWREGYSSLRASVSSDSRRSRSGDNLAHIDKKIQANLPKDAPAVTARSRKSSQYLGLFKEKDSPEEQRRREGKAKEWTDNDDGSKALATPPPFAWINDENSFAATREGSNDHSIAEEPELIDPVDGAENDEHPYEETIPVAASGRANVDNDVAGEKRAKPASKLTDEQVQSASSRVMREMRNRHDIELDSDVEKLLLRTSSSRRVTGSGFTSPKPRTPVEEPAVFLSEGSDTSNQPLPGTDEDDESEHEQISSAFYYPHRQVIPEPDLESILGPLEGERTPTEATSELPIATRDHLPSVEEEQMQPVTEPKDAEIEIALKSEAENQVLHGELPLSSSAVPTSTTGYASSHDYGTHSESELDSHDESSRSAFGYNSSDNDEHATTQYASTPRQHHDYYKQRAPLGAVELKPYDHQVGGHSTVYRFSRRAVCKQLNNRENEFYETVEREHPELLEFLPR